MAPPDRDLAIEQVAVMREMAKVLWAMRRRVHPLVYSAIGQLVIDLAELHVAIKHCHGGTTPNRSRWRRPGRWQARRVRRGNQWPVCHVTPGDVHRSPC